MHGHDGQLHEGSTSIGAMLIYVCCVLPVFLRFTHRLFLKYQYNKYMFNLIVNYSFIAVSGGCVGTGPSALLSSGAYHTVKMVMSLLVYILTGTKFVLS